MFPSIKDLHRAIKNSGYHIDKEMSKDEIYDYVKMWQQIISAYFTDEQIKYLCQGEKAFDRYLKQTHEGLFIVSLLGSRMIPNACSESAKWKFGFHISGKLAPPDLREFHNLEFSITDTMLNWTFIHTHEDFSYGGPYFVLIKD